MDPENSGSSREDEPEDEPPGADERFTMIGEIDGQSVDVTTDEPNIQFFDDQGDGRFRVTTPDGALGLEFPELQAFAGTRNYSIRVDLFDSVGLWAQEIFSPYGYNNELAYSGFLMFDRLDQELWEGSYTLQADWGDQAGDVSFLVSGEFVFDMKPYDLPETAFDDILTAANARFVATGTVRGASVSVDTNAPDVSSAENQGLPSLAIQGVSGDAASSGSEVGLSLGLPSTDDSERRLYGPSLVAGLNTTVSSSLIADAEGFSGSALWNGTLWLTTGDGYAEGRYEFLTNLRDTLTGEFVVRLPVDFKTVDIADLQVTPELLFDIPDADYEDLVYNPDDNTLNVLNHASSTIDTYAMDGSAGGTLSTDLSHWSGDEWRNTGGLTIYNGEFLVTAVDDYTRLYSIAPAGGVSGSLSMDSGRYVQGLAYDGQDFWIYDADYGSLPDDPTRVSGALFRVGTDGVEKQRIFLPTTGNWSSVSPPSGDTPLFVILENQEGVSLVQVDPASGRVTGEGTFDAPSTDAFTGLTSDGTNLYAVANAIYRLNVTAR